jgi:hypothetical protein
MPSRGIFHKLTGGEARDDREMNITSRRTHDIELPNPRKPKTPNVLEGLRKAGEGLKVARKLGRVE